MGPFETWASKLRLPWMGKVGRAIIGAFAKVLGDDGVVWAQQANVEHFPQYAGDPDSVALTASERVIDQGPTESTADLALRVVAAASTWKLAGTPMGVLIALHYAGFPDGVLVTVNGRAYQWSPPPGFVAGADPSAGLTRTDLGDCPFVAAGVLPALAYGDSPWWTFDASSVDASSPAQQFTSRFALVFPGPNYPSPFVQSALATATFTGVEDGSDAHPWPTATWSTPFPTDEYAAIPGPACVTDGSGPIAVVADGTTKTTSSVKVRASGLFAGTVDLVGYSVGQITAGDLARLRSIIQSWRAEKATCVGIYVVPRGRCFDWPPCTFADITTFSDGVVVAYDS